METDKADRTVKADKAEMVTIMAITTAIHSVRLKDRHLLQGNRRTDLHPKGKEEVE